MTQKSNIYKLTILSILTMIVFFFVTFFNPVNSLTVNAASASKASVSAASAYTEESPASALSSDSAIVILSCYSKTLQIGDEFQLYAFSSNLDTPTFKSSNTSVASVSTYGLITAKKAGTCKITAKVSGGEASCKITVSKTQLILNHTSYSMENTARVHLIADVSTGHSVTWKSSKSSVASVDENGWVTAQKPGTCQITATVDGTSKICRITVKTPTVKLSSSSISLYRTQTAKITATVSSGKSVTWKSNKSSVATIDSEGNIIAVKHGTAIITATVDGVSKTCTVTVKQPTIKLTKSKVTLSVGDTCKLNATVSSGVTPEWSSSNINIVSVSVNGKIRARQAGKAYIYVSEDGVKASCIVTVKEKSTSGK